MARSKSKHKRIRHKIRLLAKRRAGKRKNIYKVISNTKPESVKS